MYSIQLLLQGGYQARKWYGKNKPSHSKQDVISSLTPSLTLQTIEKMGKSAAEDFPVLWRPQLRNPRQKRLSRN